MSCVCLIDLCGTPGYLAPETLACSMYENVPGYGMEVDMWACGVILFTLYVSYSLLISFTYIGSNIYALFTYRLSGSPPFWHRRQIIMLRMIMEGNYSFSSPEWDDISDNAKDLVRFNFFSSCFISLSLAFFHLKHIKLFIFLNETSLRLKNFYKY